MAAFYTEITSVRAVPDVATLLASIRALDATAVVYEPLTPPTYTIRKATPWTAPQIAAAQTVIDTAPDATARLTAQATIDSWPIELKALVLALIDQLNTIRAALPVPLGPITPTQAIAAVRSKAGTL
jgi:hypothetical protein